MGFQNVVVIVTHGQIEAPGQLFSACTKKKAFVSSKPAPFVPRGVIIASTGMPNRATVFCGQTILRSSCGAIAEPRIFDLKVSSAILSVCMSVLTY